MNKIVEKRHFSEKVVALIVEAPLIARSRRAGHFVIVRADEHGERIPLTIADYDREVGTVTFIFQIVGKTTMMLNQLNKGGAILDFIGHWVKLPNWKGTSMWLSSAAVPVVQLHIPKRKRCMLWEPL